MAQQLSLEGTNVARQMDRRALAILSNVVVGMEPEAWCTLGENFTTEWQQELQPRAPSSKSTRLSQS